MPSRIKIVYDDGSCLPSKIFTCTRYDSKTGDFMSGDTEDVFDEIDGQAKLQFENPLSQDDTEYDIERMEATDLFDNGNYSRRMSEIPTETKLQCSDEFTADGLQRHNFLRALHGCPPLQLDDKLIEECEAYAKVLAKKEKMEHSSASDYGENLAYAMNSAGASMTGAQAADNWYSEIKDYDFDRDDNVLSETGHFTQVVWKNCTKVGMGYALSDDKKKVFVVARYTPAGNFVGQYKENIPHPLNGTKFMP